MRKMWRWRLCAIGWVAGAYLCLLSMISVVNITSPSRTHPERQLATSLNAQNNPSTGLWRMTVRRKVRSREITLKWCRTLRWIDPPGPPTALVSFPGSGNTWLRYLIQQATGLFTGSVYKDFALLKNGFPAESVSNGSVVVVKTHEYGVHARSLFARGIIILRDPYESIQSEFNRQNGGHIGHASNDKYKKDKGEYWQKFATIKAVTWMNTTLDWMNFQGSLHIVFYRDLLANLTTEMIKIFAFLEIKVSEKEFNCMMKHQNGIYRRKKKNLPFRPFGPVLRNWVEVCKDILGKSIKKYLTDHLMTEALSRYQLSFFNSSYQHW